MTPPVKLDSGLKGDDLLDGRGGLGLGLEGREVLFEVVKVGNVGLVVFLMVQLHDIFDDMRFEGLSITKRGLDEVILYYISPRRYNAEENENDNDNDDDDDDDKDH